MKTSQHAIELVVTSIDEDGYFHETHPVLWWTDDELPRILDPRGGGTISVSEFLERRSGDYFPASQIAFRPVQPEPVDVASIVEAIDATVAERIEVPLDHLADASSELARTMSATAERIGEIADAPTSVYVTVPESPTTTTEEVNE